MLHAPAPLHCIGFAHGTQAPVIKLHSFPLHAELTMSQPETQTLSAPRIAQVCPALQPARCPGVVQRRRQIPFMPMGIMTCAVGSFTHDSFIPQSAAVRQKNEQ